MSVHVRLGPANRIFLFLDKDWVKIISFSFVAYWLYAIFRFIVVLRIYHFITNSSGIREVGIRIRLSNIIPYAVLFLILGQILGIILNNRLLAKSTFVGFLISVLVFLNFPLFFPVAPDLRGLLIIDSLYPCLIFPIGALIAMAYRNSIVKRKRLRAGFIALTILMFVFFSGRQALVLYRLHFSKNDVEVRYKAEAENFSQHLDRLSDDFSRLLESHSIAWKWELMDVERYDVNGFFTVLKHLRMEPGYVLDYVYFHDRQSGFPVLYAHRSDEAAFKNYEEYRQARGEIGEDEYWDRVYGRSRTENDKKIFGYLDRVLIDDQPEGYFQYVLLRIMGSQFYLFWHADYNDQRPLFGYSQLREVMSKERDMIKRWNVWEYGPWAWLGFDPWILIHKAAELDFKPSISMGKKEVEIKIVIFTNWGGLIKRTFVVNRAFPHLLLREDQQTLIPYFCGRVF